MESPKKIQLTEEIEKDSKRFLETLKVAALHIEKCRKSGNHLEAFLFTWALIESLALPNLMRRVWNLLSHRVSIKNFPDIDRLSTSQLISNYYFLTQDHDLYAALIKGNKKRNNVIHNLYEMSLKEFNSLAKESTQFTTKKILTPIIDRLYGKKTIPVLTLYPTGWNEASQNAMKVVRKHLTGSV